MMSITLAPGQGILGGVTLDEEKVDRELAEKREKDRAYAEQERALKTEYEKIDGQLGSFLREQLEIEGRTAPITDQIRANMARFQESCTRSGFPWLPAAPQAVAEHLIVECETAAEAERLRDSISTVHLAMRLPDPTTDVLVNAAIRWFRDGEQEKPEPKRRAKAPKLNGASKKEDEKL